MVEGGVVVVVGGGGWGEKVSHIVTTKTNRGSHSSLSECTSMCQAA